MARYENVRYGGMARDLAVLVAVGVQPGRPREILGISASLSEWAHHLMYEFFKRQMGIKKTAVFLHLLQRRTDQSLRTTHCFPPLFQVHANHFPAVI